MLVGQFYIRLLHKIRYEDGYKLPAMVKKPPELLLNIRDGVDAMKNMRCQI